MTAIYSLWIRELLRFIRRPLAPAGTIALPLLMVVARGPLPANAFLIVSSFTLLFALIAIADDPRHEFLQGVAVSPVPRVALIAAKLLAAGTIVLANSVLMAALDAGLNP